MGLVSVVIPAKNEALNMEAVLAAVIQEFDRHAFDLEIIVVNDNSSDQTADIVQAYGRKDDRVRLIHNPGPFGIGNAIKKGLESFKGDCVLITMADLSDDPKDMIRYVKELEKGYDCCFGTRWCKEIRIQNYPGHKLYLNRLANFCIRCLFGISYNDTTNAFKAYSREVISGIQPVLSHHFNITVELPLKAIVRGYTYQVIPTHWYGRQKGASSLRLKEMGSRYLFIIMYVFLEKLLCGKDYKKAEHEKA